MRRECVELGTRLEEAKQDKNASEKKGKKGKGKTITDRPEIGYYISSMPVEAASDMEMLEVISGHWLGIETARICCAT